MRRVFLSTLGTGHYVPCHYETKDDGWRSPLTPFIQEALVIRACTEWTPEDRIAIFCTKQAEATNWIDRPNEGGGRREGLASRLRGLGLAATLQMVPIPDGKSEDEIMEIFSIVSGYLQAEDAVTLDITHSFRSLPLLNLAILNYAKALKRISVAGIHYGAFEVLGRQQEVAQMPEAERTAPIFDLTPYDALLDWSRAVDDFVSYGIADGIEKLVRSAVSAIFNQKDKPVGSAPMFRDMAARLNYMSEAILTARCKEISRFDSLAPLVDQLKGEDVIPPLRPLLDRITEKTAPFSGEAPEEKGFAAVHWCIEHNLIPQGFTILLETIVSGMCRLLELDSSDERDRKLISSLLSVMAANQPESTWRDELGQRRDEARSIQQRFGSGLGDLARTYGALARARNDINHGGCRSNPSKAKGLIGKLPEYFNSVRTAWAKIASQTRVDVVK